MYPLTEAAPVVIPVVSGAVVGITPLVRARVVDAAVLEGVEAAVVAPVVRAEVVAPAEVVTPVVIALVVTFPLVATALGVVTPVVEGKTFCSTLPMVTSFNP